MHRQTFPRLPVEAKHGGKNIPLCFEKWLLPPARKFKGNVNKIRVRFQAASKACGYSEFSPWQWGKHNGRRLQGNLARRSAEQLQRGRMLLCQMLIFNHSFSVSKLCFSVHRGHLQLSQLKETLIYLQIWTKTAQTWIKTKISTISSLRGSL